MSLPVRLLVVLLSTTSPTTATVQDACSMETVRQPWDRVEMPWVLYVDLTCPSDSGLVDDSAIYHALVE